MTIWQLHPRFLLSSSTAQVNLKHQQLTKFNNAILSMICSGAATLNKKYL